MDFIKNTVLLLVMLAFCQSPVWAEGRDAYYVGEKLKGYDKGDFVVLSGDDINFRAAPKDGKVLKVLDHHSLLRVLEQHGDWLEADADGTKGYIYAPLTGQGNKDELTQEDFALGYAALGSSFNQQQAQEQLGKVQKVEQNKKLKRTDYKYASVVIGVAKKKQAVESITVLDPQFITMRGVSVGDSACRAVGQYGLPDGVVYEKDKTVYEYYWQDDKKQPLRFALEINGGSKVEAIILEKLKK